MQMTPQIRMGLILAVAAAMGIALTPRPSRSAPITAVAGDSYTIDGVHSTVLFKIKHIGVSSSWGRFNDVAGQFTIDEKDPSADSFDVRIKTASVDTNSAARDKHVKGPDFFNAKEFPTIRFRSKSIKAADDSALDVTGELTLHGVTKPLTVKLTRVGAGPGMRGEHRCGYDAAFTVKRSDFGMKNMLSGIGDDVTLMVSLEGIKK